MQLLQELVLPLRRHRHPDQFRRRPAGLRHRRGDRVPHHHSPPVQVRQNHRGDEPRRRGAHGVCPGGAGEAAGGEPSDDHPAWQAVKEPADLGGRVRVIGVGVCSRSSISYTGFPLLA